MVALITKAAGNIENSCNSDNNASNVSDGNNQIIGIHRTYLAVIEGKVTKAPISPNKMILGKAGGGAVRLPCIDKSSINETLGKKLVIAEGIETALSIAQATSLPVWVALSASGMQNIILPPSQMIEEVIIAADYDEAGIFAAERLACRLLGEGYKAKIVTPPYKGSDFNDLLLKQTVKQTNLLQIEDRRK